MGPSVVSYDTAAAQSQADYQDALAGAAAAQANSQATDEVTFTAASGIASTTDTTASTTAQQNSAQRQTAAQNAYQTREAAAQKALDGAYARPTSNMPSIWPPPKSSTSWPAWRATRTRSPIIMRPWPGKRKPDHRVGLRAGRGHGCRSSRRRPGLESGLGRC